MSAVCREGRCYGTAWDPAGDGGRGSDGGDGDGDQCGEDGGVVDDDEASGGAGGREYYGGDDDRRGSENRDDVERKGAEQEGYGAGDDDVRQLAGQRQPGDLRAGGTDHEDHNVAGGDVDQDPAGGERRVDAAVE